MHHGQQGMKGGVQLTMKVQSSELLSHGTFYTVQTLQALQVIFYDQFPGMNL